MLNIDVDIRTLSKWLNEEQLCEIDRPALARVLGFSQLIIQNYPLKDILSKVYFQNERK